MKYKIEQSLAKSLNPVLNVTKDGFILYSNESGKLLLQEWGIKIGEKLPLSIVDIVQKVISRHSPEKLEIKVENKAYLIVFNPLSGQECVIISGFDISCQKEHKDQFVGSEEKYRAIFENSINAILHTTPD